MNEQNMMQGMQFDRFEDCEEPVAVADAVTAQPKMTKEELQQKTDEELLVMIQKAQGHTGKDFNEHMGCDFSYSYLTGVLKDRGYENGWHKVSGTAAATPKPPTEIIHRIISSAGSDPAKGSALASRQRGSAPLDTPLRCAT